MAPKQVTVIGAGVGGLAAAIRLAAQGVRVSIIEQNATVGGKMGQIERDGFRWDTGPSVITMRHVFEELFAAAGRRLEAYLTLLPVDPLTRYFYRDGTVLDATPDLRRMVRQIEALAPEDVEGYLAFLAYAAKIHRITGPVFIYGEPPSLSTLSKTSPLQFLAVDPWRTMDQAVTRRVRSPYLRKLLDRFATYVGADPFQAPATLSVIAHVELSGGVWYPQGGVYRIAQALERLARELGVAIQTGMPAEKILVRDGRAIGVRLADGATIPADAVIANVDVATVYQHLLPPEIATPARRRRQANRPTSCSGFILLLGVEGEHPRLAHHNIFFSDDYRAEFSDIFQRGRPPQEPTVYVAITAKQDPSHAPPGCENWFVLVNAPAGDKQFDWQRNAAGYRERVLQTLARHGYDIRGKIRSEVRLTPDDIARQTGAWRGALYGLSSNQALNAFRRPHNRSRELPGLYFAGGTTHPGGGVPMAALSGKVAGEMILRDWAE
ncbi:MAG: phytoene desaturase [Caldilineaceae bacterium]|nr:phytoene desaturase [Caldilineaceae bacterium]